MNLQVRKPRSLAPAYPLSLLLTLSVSWILLDCGFDGTLESTELSKGPVASVFLLGLHMLCITFRNATVLCKLLLNWQRSDFCKIF